MPRSKLAVAVFHGIAAVSLVFSSLVILRSGWSASSHPYRDTPVDATRGGEIVLNVSKPAAPKPTDPVDPKQREAVANKWVQEKLALWLDRMNMEDWKIQAKLVRTNELEPNTLGNVHWDLDAKEATIRVLSAYDYKLPFSAMLDDMQVTVVHELVHIQLANLPRSEASRGQEEHAVVELTSALLRMAK